MLLNKYLEVIATTLVLISTPALANWQTEISKDEMTEKVQAFAMSPSVKPTKRMDFPYGDVESRISVGCDNDKFWVYSGFNSKANIAGDDDEINTRIKWDDLISKIKLSLGTDSRFIHFPVGEVMVKKIISSNEVLLELPWHAEGSVYFKYPLKGASPAINKIADVCGLKIEKESFYDYLKLALSEMSFYDGSYLSVEDDKIILDVRGGIWQPYYRDSGATDLISKALKTINKVASQHNLDYGLAITVWGTTAKESRSSEEAMPFDGVALKSLLDKVIDNNPEIKSHIQKIKVGDKEPTLYGKDVEYGILVGKVRDTNEGIELQVITK
jgi:hypothetical protein